MSSPIEDINEQVRNPEFAKEYGEELAKINVAVTLARARTEKGLTQEQLAERTGTSQPYIAKLESGYANPSIGAVAKVLAVMGFRLVPGKDSLVPETKHGFHVYVSASEVEAFVSTIPTPGLVLASGLNPNSDVVLWQNPNLNRNKGFPAFTLKTEGGSVQIASEAYGSGTANNENSILAGTT
jgi:transcriptional regulator with XRE-family HTH domain